MMTFRLKPCSLKTNPKSLKTYLRVKMYKYNRDGTNVFIHYLKIQSRAFIFKLIT